MPPPHLLRTPQASALAHHAERLRGTALTQHFTAEPDRATDFRLEAAGLTLDYSRHWLDREARTTLLEAAASCGALDRLREQFRGLEVNSTERRPALHSLLRATAAPAGLEREYGQVTDTRGRMAAFASDLHSGRWPGSGGTPIRDVVNIGIGGSDLGPRLVTEALDEHRGAVRCHFVANVDPSDIDDTLRGLNPETTLFVVCSKSFRTEETLANSLAARAWMLAGGIPEARFDRHFLAVTTNLGAAADFGIPASQCLPLWDWVGGRYSVWSAIGLSVAAAVGWEVFAAFLAGAAAMDEHAAAAPPEHNMPLLLALLGAWYTTFHGATTHTVLPYCHRLRKLPDFLQQLIMESNGKRVDTSGAPLPGPTSPVIWGSAGTIGQHSFHQLLHQGSGLSPIDFILPLHGAPDREDQHRRLVANCLAQSRALLAGRSLEEAQSALADRGLEASEVARLAPHLVIPGNRPHSILLMESLTPGALGALLALYEHSTALTGYLWGINAFDQWGVELGKEIGKAILARLDGGAPEGAQLDPATEAVIDRWRAAGA